MSADQLRQELAGLLDVGRVADEPEATAAYSADGVAPAAVVQPRSQAELVEVVRWAGRRGVALAPWGGGTKQSIGRPLTRLDVVLRTDALHAVIELDEGNLTAEVEGGLAIGDLQTELQSRRLFLALDPLDGQQATLGGIVATNANGPRRLLHRTVRDHVLGLGVVLPSGEMLSTGGKTVKDVAGYNLTRPMIGSWGTLGIIVRATLRLLPLPESSATVVVRLPALQAAMDMALGVRGSELLPAAMDVCSGAAWRMAEEGYWSDGGDDGVWLLFGLESHREAVGRMASQIQAAAHRAGACEVRLEDDQGGALLWEQRRRISQALLGGGSAAARAKVSVPMASLGALLALAEQETKRRGLAVAYAAHAGNGVGHVFLVSRDGQASEEEIVAALKRLREVAAAMGGFLVLEIAPAAVKRRLDPLPPRDDYALMQRIRESFDPGNILNPGKLV